MMQPAAGTDTYALVGGDVWSSAEARLQSGFAVHIRAGQIAAVCPPEQVGADVQAIDVAGLAVVPGLIDVHVHSEDWHALLFLANGVTTVRDTGCALDEILDRRRRWNAAGAVTPRMICCGPLIDGPGDSWMPMAMIVRTPDAARSKVDRLVEAGVDQIKLYASLEWSCFLAALDQAKRHGKFVVAHLQEYGDAAQAIRAGVDEIEHLSGCAEALWPDRHTCREHWRKLWPDLERDRVERLVDLIVERKTWMAVTRAVWHKIGTAWDSRHADHPQLPYAPPPLCAWWGHQYPPVMADDLRLEWIRALAGMQIFTARLIERGGRIIAGSDTPFVNLMPGFSLHDELQLLVECGMRPSQALDAATRQAAEALGISHRVGTIQPGRAADLLVIEGDPAQDIRALARTRGVIAGGRWLDPAALLAEASQQVAAVRPRAQRRISELY
jgi:cytosine/adenosine deaminase-related metal-dependent hydrolase